VSETTGASAFVPFSDGMGGAALYLENALGTEVQGVYDARIIGTRPVVQRTKPGADGRETVALPPVCKERAMSVGPASSNASKHRRQAAACALFAANARSAHDCELLLRMQRAQLGQACFQEWLDGLPPLPPARPSALPLPKRS
jgi:hypothetical protein